MTAIFRGMFDKETFVEIVSQHNFLRKALSYISKNKVFIKFATLCMIGVLLIVASLASAGVIIGFDVKYAGEIVATVKNVSVFNAAKDLAVKTVSCDNADKFISTPKFKMTLTVANCLDNALNLADTLLEKTDEFEKVSVLRVNDKDIACVKYGELDAAVNASLKRFEFDGVENLSSFVDKVEVVIGYCLKSDVVQVDSLTEYINSLSVKMVSTVVTDFEIPYTTKKVTTNEEVVGFSKITTPGENGISRTTESIEFLNGVEISRTTLGTVTIKEPVTAVQTIGTAKSTASASERYIAGNADFIFPLSRGTYTVSAYYGDGRNHKGVDLAANKGTSIFAVASGIVTFSGSYSGYGYCVIIDHGNGLKTLYGHASKLLVSKGDKVSQGDLIALVGRTGNSTGNHLHFEVKVNEKNVDPAPFIGIG